MSAARIRLEGVTKTYALPGGDEQRALDALDLAVQSGEALCLIGGSGCGKTTTLRLMNRLAEPTAGRVLIDDRDARELEVVALRRRMGYVVQGAALFPHLTVEDNVGLLCRLEDWAEDRTRERVRELLDLVRMPAEDFAQRYPSELSGGQRQRIGVARALALDPPILLMDEPFGALDPVTRRELQDEFIELRGKQERTVILVTHDLAEAFRLGDRVALMEQGRILQIGAPGDLRDHPRDERVAAFVAHQLPLEASR